MRDARIVVVSTRAYALARMIAEDAAASGIPVRAAGGADEVAVSLLSGSATEARPAELIVAPGRPGMRLAAALSQLATGGALLLETPSPDAEEVWQQLPEAIRREVRQRELRVFATYSDPAETSGADFDDAASTFVHDVFVSGLPVLSPKTEKQLGSNGTSTDDADSPGDTRILLEIPWLEYADGPDFYADEATLRMPGVAALETSDEVRRRLVSFHHTGQTVGTRIDDAGLIPVQLFPYVSSDRIRGPYPVLIPSDPAQEPRSLSAVMDTASDPEKGAETARLVLKLEAALLEEFASDESGLLSDLWERASGRILAAASGEESEKSTREQLDQTRAGIPDGRLMEFGPGASLAILQRTIDREWSQRFEPIREDAGALAVMMEEFLRADFTGSEEGRDPEHLKAAIGKGYEQEVDFEALSKLVSSARPVEPLPSAHRLRLQSTAEDLRAIPSRLAESQRNGVLSGQDGLAQSIARAQENLRLLASLVRAVRIALLESSGSYREAYHDEMFARFGVEHLSADERALCPPCIVELGSTSALSRTVRGALMEVLTSDLPIKIVLKVDRLPSGLRDGSESDPSVLSVASLALQAVALGSAFVSQAPASQLATFVEAAKAGTQFHGPAFYSLFYGSPTSLHDPTGYLASATALESRAFPVVHFDPSGMEWADRIHIDGNPDADRPWGRGEVTYVADDSETTSLATSFTFADYLSLDPALADHFRVIAPSDWQPEMIEVDQFIEMDEAQASERIPYLWMADEQGHLARVIVTYPVTDAARAVLVKWRTLQELGGVRSSFAQRIVAEEKRKLAEEKESIEAGAQEQLRTELDRATGEVAREIVSNIAAGLLGLRPTGGMPAPAPPVPADTRPVEAAPPDDTEVTAEAEPEEPEPEEEEVITLDEPYIETPRCTTCNECTNLNSRMFAYDDNKQAYIKDASAGTFRELVLAAEKCPVRIIHPGKPLNPDEPGLNDLVQRAQPFQ